MYSMGMVTLVQEHEQTTNENQYLKNRNQINNASIEDRDNKYCREIVHSSVDTAISVAENGSLAGSSTQCSNIEDDSEDDETDIDEGDWVPDLSVPTVFQHQEIITTDGNVVLPNADVPNFGDVRVKNSTNVHLGNKTFYKGPVTIKQFVYTNPTSIQESDTVQSDNVQTSNANTFDLSTVKGNSSKNNSILSQRPNLNDTTK
ncbi:hypothetical protein E2986_01331 [Frieseomelitta varia]|uniref:Uncharacterized protein n=1 Tax=Frieseomelitta varia TaxID=561572 RepID=A0A833RKX5_9HYME|nr:hypothetical protein E2986_01331 [Frieseomelitta varia]